MDRGSSVVEELGRIGALIQKVIEFLLLLFLAH